MALLTSKDVTNLYLYGSTVTPTNLADEDLIRPNIATPATSATVDVNDYMNNGPGRFASSNFFQIVNAFFSPFSPSIAPGNYTEEEMRNLLGVNEAFITMQQWAYGDGTDDYAERVYIWNTVAFEIDDAANFVVEANGDRHIDDFAIVPFSNSGKENFDFESSDLLAILGNPTLESTVDPSGLGRDLSGNPHNVEIAFSNNITYAQNYDLAAYQADISSSVQSNPLLLATLPSKMDILLDALWASGEIKFLDSDNRPILYGTVDADALNGTTSVTGVDVSSHEYLKDYILNGIRYITGDGADTIIATDGNDVLEGAAGGDSLSGLGGNDSLYGGADNDTLIGGLGDDTLHGGDPNNPALPVGLADGEDTADYSAAAGPVSLSFDDQGVATGADGDGGTDTLISIEKIIGSSGEDTADFSSVTGPITAKKTAADETTVTFGSNGTEVILKGFEKIVGAGGR